MGYRLSNSMNYGGRSLPISMPVIRLDSNKNGCDYSALTTDKIPDLASIELDGVIKSFQNQVNTAFFSEDQLYESGRQAIAKIVIPD